MSVRAAFHSLTVAAVEPLCDDAVAVTFAVPPELEHEFAFSAGQHLTVRFTDPAGSEVRRNYSICASALGGPLRIGVRRIPGGLFSTHATEVLAAGDVLEVMPPTGRFTAPLEPGAARHHVAIAAGSGITPVLSLLTTVLEGEPGSRVTLLYGNRSATSVMFGEELSDLKDRWPDRVHVVHVLSREERDADLLHGRIDGSRLAALLDGGVVEPAGVDEWYLCGPLEMITEARAVLSERGADPAHVHFELFHVDGATLPAVRREAGDVPADAATVTALLDGRTSTVAVGRDEAILDALLRVRGDVPFACKGGVCGTCRARVLEGTVEMDHNYALEDRDTEAGFVLACQSRPTSDAVRLDFDA